ncbi:Gp157 family protein [Caldicellulosiruptor hydrothermalis 108]|uniref:Gp157 family protein n=1 Tax=Caldicellulosiruptor hydrothermalis (strain DSM 18901 / VKM B-2411 / 108) TaxID=632292 RepID=E4QDR8_CALH1|nr:siphovirus Gp157 family protein [Caldicellulosiruptor hydrothermalis]ADQ06485.1 Gp157 family protein [Caldicellulosiruptor hydrothermalis 108]
MKLYELAEQFKQLQEMLEDEGVDIDAVKNTLELVEFDFTEKIESIAKLIRSLEYEIEVYKNEEQRIANKRKSKEKKRDWLKQYVQEQMEKVGLEKVKTPLFTVSIQTNPPSVEIVDETLIPETYFRIEKIPLKKEILEALKQGQEVPGVMIKTTKSIRIR